jgi:hypothetical protein
MFEDYFNWAFSIGKEIINSKSGKEKGKDYLKRLIYEIRSEDTPGRFLEKLSEKLTEYKTNANIQAKVYVLPDIMKKEIWHADKFYYLKASILTGFLNALSSE